MGTVFLPVWLKHMLGGQEITENEIFFTNCLYAKCVFFSYFEVISKMHGSIRRSIQNAWEAVAINASFYANAWEALAKDGHGVEYDWTVVVDQLGLHFCYSDVRHCV